MMKHKKCNCLLFVIVLLSIAIKLSESYNEREVAVVNKCGYKVGLYSLDTGELQMEISDGAIDMEYFMIDEEIVVSYLYVDDDENDDEEKEYKEMTFKVSRDYEQRVNIGVDLELDIEIKSKSRKRAKSLVERCSKIMATNSKKKEYKSNEEKEAMISCIGSEMANEIWSGSHEEFLFQKNVLTSQKKQVIEYACSNPIIMPLDDYVIYEEGNVLVLHEHLEDNSHVHFIEGFISNEECSAIVPNDANDTPRFSLKGPRGVPTNDDYLDAISDRIYKHVNHYTNLELNQDGQEDLVVFHNQIEEDDDACNDDDKCHNGILFQKGQRVASIIMFCHVQQDGGSIHFFNAGINLIPKPGSAIFFSNVGGPNLTSDLGLSDYIHCPVTNGTLTGIKHNFRKGVTSQHPWNYWDSFYQGLE